MAIFKNALKIRVSKTYDVFYMGRTNFFGKTTVFFTFLRFLHFRTRILSKSQTFLARNEF